MRLLLDRGDRRAQSAVIAVVLLFGMAATISVGILVVTSESIDQTKQTAEHERVEQAFLELDSEIDAVSRSENGTSRTVDMDLSGSEGAVRQEGTGRIVVNTSNRSDPVIDQPLGAIVYEQDGTTFAYQAGAVWRNDGNETMMVARPDLDYRGTNTLTLPITSFEGDQHLSGGEVTITKRDTAAPLSDVSLVEGEFVTVNITSRFYTGWAEYFRENVDDSAIREIDHDENRVIVALGQPEINATIENGVVATGGPDADVDVDARGSGSVDGDVAAEGEVDGEADINGDVDEGVSRDLFVLDSVIQRKVDSAESNASVTDLGTITGHVTLDNGETYYADRIGGGSVTFDLSDGNVSPVVDGDIELGNGGGITVDNAGDDIARIYTTGNFSMRNTDVVVNSGDPSRFRIYGTSEMLIDISGTGNFQFNGLIYAPRNTPAVPDGETNPISGCEADACIINGGGAASFNGAIVAGSLEFDTNADFNFPSSVDGMSPDLEIDDGVYPPPITYLHASVYEVEIENSS
jgi:hypothetical protein